jgi:hypothetical protein
MKQWISLTLVLGMALAVDPTLAAEGSGAPKAGYANFQALRTLPAGEQAQLSALTDSELGIIVGARAKDQWSPPAGEKASERSPIGRGWRPIRGGCPMPPCDPTPGV